MASFAPLAPVAEEAEDALYREDELEEALLEANPNISDWRI